MGIFGQMKAFDRLEDRLRSVELKLDDLERTSRKLGLEWEDLYDKVKRQMSRMSKRTAVDAKEAVDAFNDEAVPEHGLETDPISAKILQRRGMRSKHP